MLPERCDAILRLRDTERYDDRLTVRTNLLDAYGLLMDFCERNLPSPFALDGDVRVDVRTVVCRELISNLLIHREFTSPYPAKLVIDREGLHTENASRPLYEGSITLDDFTPLPKNPSIANVFVQIGLAEELGSGTRNLFRYRSFMGVDPALADGSVFTAVIPDANGILGTGWAEPGTNDAAELAILELASRSSSFTLAQAAEAAGVTKRSASSHIAALIRAGRLIGEGATRNRRFRRA